MLQLSSNLSAYKMGAINGKFAKFCVKSNKFERNNFENTGQVEYSIMNSEDYLSENSLKFWSPNIGQLCFSRK